MFDRKEYHRKYYLEHKEAMLERSKQWQKDNPERDNENKRKWLENNPEYQRKWLENNPEKVKENRRKWREDSPEYYREYHSKNYHERRGYFLDYRVVYVRHRGTDEELCFHHVDPATKLYRMSNMFQGYQLELVQAEVDKCILLCRACHTAHHNGELD